MSVFVCKKCGRHFPLLLDTDAKPVCKVCGEVMLPVLFTQNWRDAAFNDDRNNALNSLQTAIRDVGTYYRYWCHGYKYVGETLNNMRKLLAIIEADTARKEADE